MGNNSDRIATLRDLYRRLVKASGSCGAYLNDEACMTAMLSTVVKLCSPQHGIHESVTAGHKVCPRCVVCTTSVFGVFCVDAPTCEPIGHCAPALF